MLTPGVQVLQEVAAAQHIAVICGAISVDGYAFCMGLQALHKTGNLSDFQGPIGSIAYLIRGSVFRMGRQTRRGPQETSQTSRASSMRIQPLGQLIDMYRHRKATMEHDRIYALLGMCSDNVPGELMPNYHQVSWRALFGNLARHVFGADSYVHVTDSNIAVVKAKGVALGHVSCVQNDEHRYDMQGLSVAYWDKKTKTIQETEWIAHVSAAPVQTGDIVFRQEWNQSIAILRPKGDLFSIITTSGRWNPECFKGDQAPGESDIHELLLLWDWTSQEDNIPSFIDGIVSKSKTSGQTTLMQEPNATMRRKIVAHALMSGSCHEDAERRLLALEEIFQKESNAITPAKVECSATIVLNYLRMGHVDEAEKRFKNVYLQAKATLGSNWLSQSLSQFLSLFPVDEQGEKARVWMMLKSVLDRNLTFPQSYVEIHQSFADMIADGTDAGVRLLIDLGEILVYSPKATISVPNQSGEGLYITERTIPEAEEEALMKAAAGNSKSGHTVVALLLDKFGNRAQIPEAAVQAAASNVKYGCQIMELLLGQKDSQVRITEAVLIAAAGNSFEGLRIMQFLFDKRGSRIQVTEAVLQAAAQNPREGLKLMKFFFNKKGNQIEITEAVLKAAAMNPRGVTRVPMKHKLTPGQAAAHFAMMPKGEGENIMKFLFEKKRNRLQITEGVLEAAARNEKGGLDVTVFILNAWTQFSISDTATSTALNAALVTGNTDIALVLLRWGAECIIPDQKGRTPLHNASYYGHAEVVRLLLEKVNNIDGTDHCGRTALSLAAGKGHVAVVALLLQKGILNIDGRDKTYRTALLWASSQGHTPIVDLLLDMHADPMIADVDDNTCIGVASRNGHLEVVKKLLEHGADWRVPDSSGFNTL